ncbi:integral membrane protein [Rutstroemia sp. NJR-2017a BVV2]|nr:integral membrane protein [Rutstroemia sp. NJR-2017a BVV2]
MLYPNALTAIIVCVTFATISGVAVSLRTYAHRVLLGNPLRADDWFIIAGQVIAIAICITGIYSACKVGFGWPLEEVARHGVQEEFGKMILASHVLWASSVSMVRIGLLFYYRRLFVTRTFRLADTCMIVISTLWFLVVALTTTLSFSWNTSLGTEQYSINFFGYMIAVTTLNIVLDMATLALPAFVIRSLRLSRRKKAWVLGIFALGGFCVVASGARLYYIAAYYEIKHPSPDDAESAIFHSFLWAIIEPCASILAASLPTYSPVVRKLAGRSTGMGVGVDRSGGIRGERLVGGGERGAGWRELGAGGGDGKAERGGGRMKGGSGLGSTDPKGGVAGVHEMDVIKKPDSAFMN